MPMTETAFAKINLALHVRARRDDGYHELETLFAFVDNGDRLSASPAQEDSLQVVGEFAAGLSDPFGNLVARSLSLLPHAQGLSVTLDKRLPIAAGLGGGSADAGAVFRLIEAQYGLPDDWRERAAKLGADVPACVESLCCIGSGTGTDLKPIENDLRGVPVLLVNPRIALPTGPVFAAWDGCDKGALPGGLPSQICRNGRNDLQDAAISICPEIAEVLHDLQKGDAFCVRMSGSGATCFALFENDEALHEMAGRLAETHPQWWQMTGYLR
ncbi:4-(cytidine 5'-diphospho)-2-C-methyl-D-erythritol kinase [Altericroceibacterium endophyticum]|uniref:4-diphosphocytidyl-2-C-methyl-D-erythritol kinase n=1 Tax=Altericroceibacterium endophyticum TaxID=1808508 RepID=A0A6I4T440_9SPHN|nr:4-(cytidine 5'-diphospho)-2-C-methyl-D-erythritol kinase [Altericroceibacterium endophyticum]MXO66044.1 4-(cytidine 5'-diphospho)-2-C-methyl-D-erythritol kinase [Altericroceibacterium endophyticum]